MPFLPLALLLAQVTPVQPIVKGTGLPPPAADDTGPAQGSDEAAVMASVEALFAGLEASDDTAIRARLWPTAGATAVGLDTAGRTQVRRFSWEQWLGSLRSGGPRRQERFVGQPAVEVDGDIAMVWGEYVLRVGGKVEHCGVDHFDMVRENGAWKVQNVTWSQRTTGCSG